MRSDYIRHTLHMNQETKITLKQIHTHKRKLNISYRKPLKNIDNNSHKKIQFHKRKKSRTSRLLLWH